MTENKNKFLIIILLLLPFIYLYNGFFIIDKISVDLLFKLVLTIYFVYYLIFRTNSKYKSICGIILLLGVFCFLYLGVELNSLRLKYISSYIEYIYNFLLLPFTLISMICIFNDTGFDKNSYSNLIIYNLLIYSIYNILGLDFSIQNTRELSILTILLYPLLLIRLKPNVLTIGLYSFIIYGLSLLTNVYMLLGIGIILLISFIPNIKKKEYNSFLLITLLFLIINFTFDKSIIFYKFSFLNFITLFPLLIIFITLYIYNIKNKKTKLSIETILLLTSILIISYILLFERTLVYNYYLAFYICLEYSYIANNINLFEKEKINHKKIVFLAPITSRFNSKNDSIDFAKLLDDTLNIEIVFKNEDKLFYKFPQKATILYLSENNKSNIKDLVRKYVMYSNAGVLVALDNDTAKIINKYSRVEAKKIMIKQSDFTSIKYGKFLRKKLKNIPILVFTSKRALNIYSSVLSTKKCYYIDKIGNCLEEVLEDKNV